MSEQKDGTNADSLQDVRDYIKEEAAEDAEDHEFDFLKDIPRVDPTVEQTRTMVQEEITKAMQNLSVTDQDIFESTGLIHLNREINGETLVNHAVRMQKIGNRRHERAKALILILVLAGTAICAAGIFLQHTAGSNTSKAKESAENPDLVPSDAENIAIDEASFPDAAFRLWIEDSADSNDDGMLSPEERNNLLIILCSGNDQLASVQGIEFFPQLQGVDFSNTQITECDVSQNHMLEYISISGTNVTSLDLRENTALTEVNVSSCSSLSELLMPEPSTVKELEISGTSLNCDSDNDGNYTACKVAAQ